MALRDVLKLLQDIFDISDTELAKETSIPQPTIHRLRSGMSPDPKISTLLPLANFFNVTIGQIAGFEPLPSNIKDRESFLHRSSGVLKVPIISWEQAKQAKSILNDITPFNWADWIDSTIATSNSTYALKISQHFRNPYFNKGNIVVVDLDKQPQEYSYVLIKKKNHTVPSIMTWLKDGGVVYLAPLQKEILTSQLMPEDLFCGVIIETKVFFSGSES